MPDSSQHRPDSREPGERASAPRVSVTSRLERFEKRQNELWRLTFALLLILAVVFAWTSWDSVRQMTSRLEALPIGLVVLVALFGIYSWRRTQEIAELRGLVRGIEHRDAGPPSDHQLDQLFSMIAESQQGYRELIDSFDDLLLAVDLEGSICAANRSFAELVGVPFQQIIGRKLVDFLEDGAEGRKAVERGLPRFLERRHWAGSIPVRIKDRPAPYFFDCIAHAMLRGGQVSGVTILARNITAQRENEARFTELFESLQEGIYITTPQGQIVDVNPALVRMLGYASKDELLSRRVPEVFADPPGEELLRQEANNLYVLHDREITLLRKDGTPVSCLNTVAVVHDAAGQVLRYQGALMDITERREMERRLHKQQEFARRLVDSLPDLILVIDTAGQFTFVSPRFKEVLGIELNEDNAAEFGSHVHPEDLTPLRKIFAEIMSGQQSSASLEARVRHQQGDWRRVLSHFNPLFNETGKIDGVIVSGRDITQLKRLEEQLIQSEKLAAMGQMLAGVAHELNNPLTAVLGITELLRDRLAGDATTQRQLELTHRQARRAARIVQNLLEFSRPATTQKRPLDVNTLIERTLQLHEHSLRRNNVIVDFRADPALPRVVGDANQLIQVFLNLIGNAEHAIREVREAGRIEIRVARRDERIAVTVQDDGIGIRSEALPKLFDPFYTTRRPTGGSGLGLSMSMAIIREHQGTIEAESLSDVGSVFTVSLPIAGENEPSQMTAGLAEGRGVGNPAAGIHEGRAVLVVDDEEGIRQLLQEGLSAQRLHVDAAANCEEALALAQRCEYDAILCDVNLAAGGVSGRETAQRILDVSHGRKPAIVLMTGDLLDPNGGNGVSGQSRSLQKPFRISEVLALLSEIFLASDAEALRK